MPPGHLWSLWAKPILFAQMAESSSGSVGGESWRALDVSQAPAASEHAVLVVDLEAEESVRFGLALAARGYRPVPLYNACTGPHEVIDQRPILEALRNGTGFLASQSL